MVQPESECESVSSDALPSMPVVLKLNMHQNYLEVLVKYRLQSPTPRMILYQATASLRSCPWTSSINIICEVVANANYWAPCESETPGWGPEICVLTGLLGDSGTFSSFRTTALYYLSSTYFLFLIAPNMQNPTEAKVLPLN